MKTFFFLLGFFLIFSASQAQIRLGVKAGVSSASIKADKSVKIVNDRGITDEFKIKAQQATLGYHLGIFSRISFLNIPLHLQPELLFSSLGGKYTISKADKVLKENIKQTLNRVDIPLLLGYKASSLRIVAGPVGSFMLSKGFSEESAENFRNDFKAVTWGAQIGLGLDIADFLTLDLRYESGLGKLDKSTKIGNKTFNLDTRTSQILFSVGIFVL